MTAAEERRLITAIFAAALLAKGSDLATVMQQAETIADAFFATYAEEVAQ